MSERLNTEKVPIVEGLHLLATLHFRNQVDGLGLVYRGGSRPIDIARADVPYWWRDADDERYADSEYPVVCADTSPLVPAFCALAPPGQREYFGNEAGGVSFRVNDEAAEAFRNATGFVTVFSDDDFRPFYGDAPPGWPWGRPLRLPEARAASDQAALLNVRVTIIDFFELLENDPHSVLEVCSRLKGE